ncbi:zinc-dependent alcohol dehydrogenase [Vagococcus elongatus]|uniref:Enoyl reductase (ER) domain-containing protein n=1 Tax=Vagococcus elongatus TaxID=180344 RepID=A0A430B5G6_9ENTE|nr:alcohol dehydrogenase catalytic domain-containing protein [Vagococcus elongatus]RSU15507.1 hypothetical protein CBF29_00045 [Vagococcus elongatus]
MRALWKSESGSLVFRNLKEPEVIAPDDVKIKVLYNTISETDLRFRRENDFYSRAGIPGYEMSGIIADLGEQAVKDGFEIGQRVSSTPFLFCGKCEFCKRNKHNCCISLQVDSGSLCEYVVRKSSQLVIAPDGLTDKMICLIEPLAVSLEAVSKLDLTFGQSLCVMSGSFEGLVMAKLASRLGALHVSVVEASEVIRDLAKRNGVNHAIDSRDLDHVNQLHQLTDFNGFDAIVENTVDLTYLNHAIDLVAKGGKILLTNSSGFGKMVSTNSFNLIINNISIDTAFLYSRQTMNLSAKILPTLHLEEFIMKEFDFSESLRAFEALKSGNYPRIAIKMRRS